MRHLKHHRSGTLVQTHRGVILPPLATTWVEKNPHLVTTKILVNKGKGNDVAAAAAAAAAAELVSVGRAGGGMEGTVSTSKCTDPLLRIAQLEQNIRFLQEQHQTMLAGLHLEIDSLRQRNRDLQFQLVFTKGSIVSPSSASPSSPEEDVKVRVLSPKQVNVTPLQVELLERELGELKVSLQEVNTRNVYLTSIIDEQKKKLERQTDQQQLQQQQQLQLQQASIVTAADPELLSKLDDVESLVRKLRRENDELRREVTDIRSTASGGGGGNQHRGGRHRGNNHHNHHYRGHRFPPLHTQSYWHGKGGGGGGGGTGGDMVVDTVSGSTTTNTTPPPPGTGGGLPTLHNMNQAPIQSPPPPQQGHGGGGGGGHHYSGGGGGGGRRHHHHHNNNHHQYQQQQQQQQGSSTGGEQHRKYRGAGGGGGQARSNNKP